MRIHSIVISIICLVLYSAPALSEWHRFTYTAMTTPISLVFWENDQHRAQVIRRKVFDEFDQIEQQMSRYIESSELSELNRSAYLAPMAVSDSLYTLIRSAMAISQMSRGAFDITFASVGYLYDFRKGLRPKRDEIDRLLPLLNFQHIHLDDQAHTIHFRKQGTLIDLGGIAKGYAVDRGIHILMQQGVEFAHLSAGGDMRLLGDKRGKPWIIGIKNPRDNTKQSILLPLSNTAISTSGDYERFFIDQNGERVHHILSPKTGKPAQGIRSVTILAQDTVTSDGLSTAVFVLGVKEGVTLINSLAGVDAIVIDEHGTVHYSKGLERPKVETH